MIVAKTKAFTLVELMITISIVAIIATLAVPSFSTLLSNRQADVASVTLKKDLIFARNAAKTEAQNVSVAPVSDQFENGWVVTGLNDGRTLRQASALGQGIDVTSTAGTTTASPIVFSGNSGRVLAGAGDILQVRSTGCSGNSNADISILASGQIFLTNIGC